MPGGGMVSILRSCILIVSCCRYNEDGVRTRVTQYHEVS